MKVVMMATGSDDTMGGETRVALEISEAMSKVVETAIVLTGEEDEIIKEGSLTKVYVKGHRADISDTMLPNLTRQVIVHVNDFLDQFQPDVIHSHSLFGTPILGQVWARMNGIPYFHTVHILPSKMASFLEMPEESFKYTLLYKGFLKSFFQSYMKNCNGVVALNQIALKELQKSRFDTDFHIIPNGRFLEQYNDLKVADITTNNKILVFIGSYSIRKNQVFLVKMMKYLPDNYKLIMVGRAIIESYRKVLDEAIGENKNIDAKESVQHIEVPPLLEKAHLFVSASKVEVQALSVIEALASATPVVGLSNETIDELITENNGVWLKKNTSPKNFAKAVRRVLEDEENYERLSRNARESVKEFDWDKVVKRTLEMYSQYESKTKKIDHKTTKSQVSKLVDSFPDFPGKKYLYESISDWGEMSKKRVKKIVSLRKVSKRVLLFTGLTVGLFATIYGISQVRKAAKNVRRKVSK